MSEGALPDRGGGFLTGLLLGGLGGVVLAMLTPQSGEHPATWSRWARSNRPGPDAKVMLGNNFRASPSAADHLTARSDRGC